MSLISSLGSLSSALQPRQVTPPKLEPLPSGLRPQGPSSIPSIEQPASFGKLIEAVESKQLDSAAAARDVMLGKTDQIHQSVIAMQEASVSLNLMIEVRNKLVEGYQELLRMPV